MFASLAAFETNKSSDTLRHAKSEPEYQEYIDDFTIPRVKPAIRVKPRLFFTGLVAVLTTFLLR
jgi:hypothetical protein